MDVLAIYDMEGYVLDSKEGSTLREPVGVPFMRVTIPTGKRLKSFDVTQNPHLPVFEDEKQTGAQALENKVNLMQKAIDDLILAGGVL